MNSREQGLTQETAAAKGGMSVRSGRRIEKGTHQPARVRQSWGRTRADPLAGVWEQELVPMLEGQPQLQALTLLEHLQQQYPGQYGRSVLRTKVYSGTGHQNSLRFSTRLIGGFYG
jgi:hypothetical protein